MSDVSGAENLFKKVVQPSLNAGQHSAVKPGIKLRSWSPSRPLTQQSVPIHGRVRPTPRSKTSLGYPMTAEYIQDVVVPIQVHQDETNIKRSGSPWMFCSTSKFKKVALPQVTADDSSLRYPTISSKGLRAVPLATDRYLSSTPSECSVLNGDFSTSGKSQGQRWNKSGQALRLESEQMAVEHSRMLKRTSECVSHRMDRMYYMCGRQLNMRDKYKINEFELDQLRALQKSRQTNKYYGRDIRQMNTKQGQSEVNTQSSPNADLPAKPDHKTEGDTQPRTSNTSRGEEDDCLPQQPDGLFLTEQSEVMSDISVDVQQRLVQRNDDKIDEDNQTHEEVMKDFQIYADENLRTADDTELGPVVDSQVQVSELVLNPDTGATNSNQANDATETDIPAPSTKLWEESGGKNIDMSTLNKNISEIEHN